MTPTTRQQARRATVVLTRQQIEMIVSDMGWEPEDADVFWQMARRENRNPGSIERDRTAYWAPILSEAASAS